MKIYFNWLGKEIELDNENDTINEMKPDTFFESMIKGDYEEKIKNNEYIDIQKDGHTYYVPITSIVGCEKKATFINEERW